jgi:tetratricopeptide (TPR) repeat protein
MTSKCIFLILMGASIVCGAVDPSDCEAIINQVNANPPSGKVQEADLKLSRLVRLPEGEGPCLGIALNDLAVVRQRQGRLDEAERYASRSVRVLEKDPLNRPVLVHPLIVLAQVSIARKQFRKARVAIAEAESIPKNRAPEYALLLGMEAQLLVAEHHPDDAAAKFRAAVVQWEKAGEGETSNVIPELTNLSELYISQGRFAEARVVIDRALPLAEHDPNPTGLIHLLNNVAVIYYREHDWHDAELCFLRATELPVAGYYVDPPLLRDLYANYADLLRRTGRKREAKALEMQANALFGRDIRSLSVDVDDLIPLSKRGK